MDRSRLGMSIRAAQHHRGYCACRTAYTTHREHLRRKCYCYHQLMLVLKGPLKGSLSFKAHTKTSHTTPLSGKEPFLQLLFKNQGRTSEHHQRHANKAKLRNSSNNYRMSHRTHLLHKQNWDKTEVSSLPVLRTI